MIYTYLQIDSPRFGLTIASITIRPIKKGEEIYSFYGYVDLLKKNPEREWYYDQWQEYKKKYPNSPKIKLYEAQAKQHLKNDNQ